MWNIADKSQSWESHFRSHPVPSHRVTSDTRVGTMRMRPSPHAHWRRDDVRGQRNNININVGKKDKHHVTLL